MDSFEVYLLDRIYSIKADIDRNKEDRSYCVYYEDCIHELLDVFIAYREKYKIWSSPWYDEN